jgi:hypothetical protein
LNNNQIHKAPANAEGYEPKLENMCHKLRDVFLGVLRVSYMKQVSENMLPSDSNAIVYLLGSIDIAFDNTRVELTDLEPIKTALKVRIHPAPFHISCTPFSLSISFRSVETIARQSNCSIQPPLAQPHRRDFLHAALLHRGAHARPEGGGRFLRRGEQQLLPRFRLAKCLLTRLLRSPKRGNPTSTRRRRGLSWTRYAVEAEVFDDTRLLIKCLLLSRKLWLPKRSLCWTNSRRSTSKR